MSSPFVSAARAFAGLIREVPDTAWDGPGLGDWDLRALAGHASRSLITVSTYLQSTADREDVTGPADYYAKIRDYASDVGGEAIVERGRQAGRDLGDRPAERVDALVQQVLGDLAGARDPLIEVIGGLGIRLTNYLPTRTFELTVHGLDIARVAGIPFTPPHDAMTESTALAAEIGAAVGHGEAILLALTGRAALPSAFSVV